MAVKRSGRSGPAEAATTQPQGGEASLSRERIATAAVDLLDANGIGGLTMRSLADRLGCGVMSLYWYVKNKEDVFDLALDTVLDYRGPDEHDLPSDWRSEVIAVLEDWRASMLLHPWSAALLPRRALGPNILRRLEFLGKRLSDAGVADADLNVALWALWNHVMGAAVTRVSFERAPNGQPAADLGGNYPIIAGSGLLLDDDWDGAFRRGIDFLLDGLAPRR